MKSMITEEELRRFYDMAEDLFRTAQRFRTSERPDDDMRLVGCLNRYEYVRNEIVWPWTPTGPGEPTKPRRRPRATP